MKRLPLTVGATAVALAAAPAVALAQPPTAAHVHAYEHAYHQVARALGPRVPGRNIIEDGVAHRRRPSDAQTVASLRVLGRMIAPSPSPSPAPTTATATGAATTATAATSSAGAAGVPSCASESGTNYSTGGSNTNASSGATGRYQILPSTAAAYGCDLSTAAGQDACAQVIYQHQGAGAWVGCGG